MMFYENCPGRLSEEEILEKERVRELVEYDRYCNDYHHKEEQAKLWFPDGRVITTWFNGSFEQYRTASPVSGEKRPVVEAPEQIPGLRVLVNHRVNNTLVWLKGTRAVAEVICTLCFRTPLGWDWVDLTCMCRMHYRCEKRDGRWGIVYFEGIYERDSLKPLFGENKLTVTEQELEKYRPINRYMGYRRDRFEGGVDYSAQWAGSDKPQTVERIYNESSRWLSGEKEA